MMNGQQSGACTQEALANVTQRGTTGHGLIRLSGADSLVFASVASPNAPALTVGASVFRLGFELYG